MKKILLDARHHEEIRVAIISSNGLIEEYETENANNNFTKGNIYLAKVIRVEQSLQAAFVEYGSGRHGFLPFNELHIDYFHISDKEREKFKKDISSPNEVVPVDDEEVGVIVEKPQKITERYKIQNVLKPGQILMVQVAREERGTKGALLTTYLSLPGRYNILMPNSFPGGIGISRKITPESKRKRLKKWLETLVLAPSMKIIIRSAGEDRRSPELKRDLKYLSNFWEELKDTASNVRAPALLFNEANLTQRVVRDMYRGEVEEILVEGEEAYKEAKDIMKKMSPSQAKNVKLYKSKEGQSLFIAHGVEEQIRTMFDHHVPLPSGGYIVIDQTEALVAIDVNSGRAISGTNLSATALQTNLEAAQVAARHIRLRDLAGLIVIDFIDMNDDQHIEQVEKTFKEAIKEDRSRIQTMPISALGLLELSRQRKKLSLQEINATPCGHCQGRGVLRSPMHLGLSLLHQLEEVASRSKQNLIRVAIPKAIQNFLQNEKRRDIFSIEEKNKIHIHFYVDLTLSGNDYRIEDETVALFLPSSDKKPYLSDFREKSIIPKKLEKKINDNEKNPDQGNEKHKGHKPHTPKPQGQKTEEKQKQHHQKQKPHQKQNQEKKSHISENKNVEKHTSNHGSLKENASQKETNITGSQPSLPHDSLKDISVMPSNVNPESAALPISAFDEKSSLNQGSLNQGLTNKGSDTLSKSAKRRRTRRKKSSKNPQQSIPNEVEKNKEELFQEKGSQEKNLSDNKLTDKDSKAPAIKDFAKKEAQKAQVEKKEISAMVGEAAVPSSPVITNAPPSPTNAPTPPITTPSSVSKKPLRRGPRKSIYGTKQNHHRHNQFSQKEGAASSSKKERPSKEDDGIFDIVK
jgi:ribonuclease E